MRKALFALAALAVTLAAPAAFAQVNNPKEAIQFHGNANVNGVATIDITGNMVGYSSTNPLRVHITDGTHDVTCSFVTYSPYAVTYNSYAGNIAGMFTLDVAYAQCVNNKAGGALITGSGHMTFDRSMQNQAAGASWFIQADNTYMDFYCPSLWVVSPFSGVGIVNNP